MDADEHQRHKPGDGWPSFTIQGELQVRGRLRGRQGVRRGSGRSRGPNHQAASASPLARLTVAFVQARLSEAPEETWTARFEAFKAAYPDQTYRSMRTFRQAYYDQQKKAAKPGAAT